MAVNVRSVITGSRAFGAQMVERGEGGTIINLSSAAAFLPSKSMVAYSTTKAAVLGFSESLRADLADEGITVTAVCPGFVNTNIAKSTVYAGFSAEQQERPGRRRTPHTGGATSPRKPPPRRSSSPSGVARPSCRSPRSPGSAMRCAASAHPRSGCWPAWTFGRSRKVTVPESIWTSRPADLYGRRDHDRFYTAAVGCAHDAGRTRRGLAVESFSGDAGATHAPRQGHRTQTRGNGRGRTDVGRPGWRIAAVLDAGWTHRCPVALGPTPAVLAVWSARAAHRLPYRRAPHRRWRRRFDRDA